MLPLFLSIAASIKTISMSLNKERKSTELFLLNQLAKSLGEGGSSSILFVISSFITEEVAKLSKLSHTTFCSSA